METPDDEFEQRCEALMNQGYEHLQQEEFEEALEVARKLEELQYTGAFEIAALAHEELGDLEAAVGVLHRGVEVAPESWPNWQLLGNFLSDLERFEEAEAAYEQALDCDEAWKAAIWLNQAILAARREQHEKASELLDLVDDPDLKLDVAECRIANLKHLGRTDEARVLAEVILAEYHDNREEGDTLARIAALLGQIRLAAGEDKTELREIALGWLDVDPNSEAILDLIRDVDGKYAEHARYYRLLLHAEIPDGHPLSAEAVGYFATCEVVAENLDEALEFVRELADPVLGPLLEIEEIELDEEADPDEPKGVCGRSPMHLYESDD